MKKLTGILMVLVLLLAFSQAFSCESKEGVKDGADVVSEPDVVQVVPDVVKVKPEVYQVLPKTEIPIVTSTSTANYLVNNLSNDNFNEIPRNDFSIPLPGYNSVIAYDPDDHDRYGRKIKDMVVGESGWMTPWQVEVDTLGRCWLEKDDIVDNIQGGTLQARVTRQKWGYTVYIAEDSRIWSKDCAIDKVYRGQRNMVPVKELRVAGTTAKVVDGQAILPEEFYKVSLDSMKFGDILWTTAHSIVRDEAGNYWLDPDAVVVSKRNGASQVSIEKRKVTINVLGRKMVTKSRFIAKCFDTPEHKWAWGQLPGEGVKGWTRIHQMTIKY